MGGYFYSLLIFAPMYVSLFWSIVLLATKKESNAAKRFLGLFMIAASMVYFSHSVFFSHQLFLYRIIDPFYIFASLSVYPLFFIYLKILTIDIRLIPCNIVHLIPSITLSVSTGLIYLFMDNPGEYVSTNLFHQNEEIPQNRFLWKAQEINHFLIKLTFFIQVLFYLHKGSGLIRSYKTRIEDFYSNLEGRRIDWARTWMIVFAITAIMSSVVNFIGRSFFRENPDLMAVPALIFSSLLFSIGYLAHVQKHSAYELKKDEEEAERFAADNYEHGSIIIDHADGTGNVAILRQLLLAQFEIEKIYLRPDLKISTLAILLKSNRTYISRLINEEFHCSFSDFVGKYRIEEAKKLLQSSLLDDHTLESVAERTGFTSVASLIRTFKQFEGITPGVYRNKVRHSG